MIKLIFFFLSVYNLQAFPIVSKQTDAPWYALFNITGLRCGGTLIREKYILTAAHCFDKFRTENELTDVDRIQIVLGDWKLLQEEDCKDSQESCDPPVPVRASKMDLHPNYDNLTKQNDIAIIELSRVLRKTELIRNAFLPIQEECNEILNRTITVGGFGNHPSLPDYTNERKRMDLKVMSHEECQRHYPGKYNESVHFCGADNDGHATCRGDSGGGALYQYEDENFLAVGSLKGIVSFGATNCGDQKPSVFTKVACYMNWINQITGLPSTSENSSSDLSRVQAAAETPMETDTDF